MKRLLAMDVVSILPLLEEPVCLLQSEFLDSFQSVFKVKLDANDWIVKVSAVDREKGVLKLSVFSKFNVSTVGKVSYELQFTSVDKESSSLEWTITYTDDLDKAVVERMLKRRTEIIEYLGQNEVRL